MQNISILIYLARQWEPRTNRRRRWAGGLPSIHSTEHIGEFPVGLWLELPLFRRFTFSSQTGEYRAYREYRHKYAKNSKIYESEVMSAF